jgi:hypothetical protein
MSQKIKVDSILIKENFSFPVGVTVDSEAYSPGWKLVRNLDGYGLARIIVKARWKFFYLGGGMRVIAFGSESQGTLHKALKRIVTKPEGQHDNALEITSVVARRFLGVSFEGHGELPPYSRRCWPNSSQGFYPGRAGIGSK